LKSTTSTTPKKASKKASADYDGNNDEPSAFTTATATPTNSITVNSSHLTTSYALHDSFILDSRATIHCYNARERFHNLTPAAVGDILFAGKDQIQIEEYGDVYITAEDPDGSKRILLWKVAYVPTLHTSVVSLPKFIEQNVHWNTQQNWLTYKDNTFCFTPIKHGQFVLEYNPLQAAYPAVKSAPPKPTLRASARPKPASKATIDLWHKRLGHLREKAIRHLPTAARDVKIVSRDWYTIPPCQTCRLSSAKQIISRILMDRATRPFAKVYLDLIQMCLALDNSKYI
jgi:hypothetical protein